jgi:hypothetical protein
LWLQGADCHEEAPLKIGEKVLVARVPDAVLRRKADHLNTRRISELCIGRVFPIAGLSNGLIELHVGEVVGQPAYIHSIWIEPDCIETV